MRAYIHAFLIILVMVTITVVVSSSPVAQIPLEIQYKQLSTETRKQINCLAENIYREAGYEPQDGKIAVALVTLNRTQDERFPNEVCSVVKQRTSKVCQFSWFCEPVKSIRSSQAYEEAMRIAIFTYINYEYIKDITNGALYYHADYVNPRWKLQKTVVIGRHIFYKEGHTYDAKTKFTITGRPGQSPLVFPVDGGDLSRYVQTSN